MFRRQFAAFLKGCSRMRPSSEVLIRPGPARDAYSCILAYMTAVVLVTRDIGGTFALLTKLHNSNSPQDLIQKKPFLLIVVCFYLDAAAKWIRVGDECDLLLNTILKSCGTTKGKFAYILGAMDGIYGWTGLDDAINAIYNHHNPSHQPRSNPNSSTLIFNPNGHVIV